MSGKMKAAVLYGPRDVRLEEMDIPAAGPGEVLVRVGAATTCGTDAKVYVRGGHPRMIKPPAVFGHEFAGEIAQLGSGVQGFREGMRVVAANTAPCNRCDYCKAGRQSLCDDLLYINGAYAEYAKIPRRIVEQNLLELPDHVPFAHGAIVEPLACAFHGIEESGIRIGNTVIVNGVGPIGLFFVRLAKLKGARVIATDLQDERLAAARRLGADETVNVAASDDPAAAARELTEGGRGADVVIEATGVPQVWESSLKMVRKGGIVNFFGGCAPGSRIELSTELIHYSELTVKGVYHHTPYYVRKSLDLIATGALDAREFVTAELPLERLSEALDRIVNKQGVKTAVIP